MSRHRKGDRYQSHLEGMIDRYCELVASIK